MKGLFVSDLHLFSRRSVGQERWEEVVPTLHRLSWLVLGGDIFDFRWSIFPNQEATLVAAENWLNQLISLHPQLQIAYVAGNHDCHFSMRTLLENFSNIYSTFQWHERTFRLGDKFFLHGDIIDAGSEAHGLDTYRKQFSKESKARGKVANLFYDTLVATRAHQLPQHFIHRPSQTLSRLYCCLVREGLAHGHGLRKIFFGHTHVPMFGESHRGYLFYNPGSGIRHLPFRPCLFECTLGEIPVGNRIAL
jgi:UDP-2,3-diacylglucosamine pyrophosphatase LpxH